MKDFSTNARGTTFGGGTAGHFANNEFRDYSHAPRDHKHELINQRYQMRPKKAKKRSQSTSGVDDLSSVDLDAARQDALASRLSTPKEIHKRRQKFSIESFIQSR